jgi:hypothetical protein
MITSPRAWRSSVMYREFPLHPPASAPAAITPSISQHFMRTIHLVIKIVRESKFGIVPTVSPERY